MLPRIEAEEQLTRLSAAALGSGSMRKPDARRHLRALERQAEGGQRRAIKATPAMLAGIGIAVIEHTAKDEVA